MAITDINSEDRLVQKTFADYLHDQLGWASVYAWNQETFGPRSSDSFASNRPSTASGAPPKFALSTSSAGRSQRRTSS